MKYENSNKCFALRQAQRERENGYFGKNEIATSTYGGCGNAVWLGCYLEENGEFYFVVVSFPDCCSGSWTGCLSSLVGVTFDADSIPEAMAPLI
jgi:hypothetical protein